MRQVMFVASLVTLVLALASPTPTSAQDAPRWSVAEVGASGVIPEGWVRYSDAERGPIKLLLLHEEWGQTFSISMGPAPSKPGQEGLVAMANGFAKGAKKAVGGSIVAERDISAHGRPIREIVIHGAVAGEPATSLVWVGIQRGHTLFVSSLIPGDHRDDDEDARALLMGLVLEN